MYRVIVCGSRSATDYERFEKTLLGILDRANTSHVEIIHGGCPTGADKFAHDFCMDHKIHEKVYPADWDRIGKKAGPVRNAEMAKYGADLCFGTWDGKSSGTANMISLACQYEIRVLIDPVRK